VKHYIRETDGDGMTELIERFLDMRCKKAKRFEMMELEAFIIDQCGGQSGYYMQGGYEAFYQAMQKLKQEGIIQEIKSSISNKKGKYPMKLKWSLVGKDIKQLWRDEDILMVSDRLNLKAYVKHPEYQTKEEWQYILRIHSFLKEIGKREWASVEERCLELFDDEKFLTQNKNGNKDNKVLKRLGLSLDNIKAKQYGESFVYWNKGVRHIKTIIILENHSTFFSFKKAVQKDAPIFGIYPDALIFGCGNKILSSFSFIDEIADPADIKIYYFGDIDPAGLSIYAGLKERTPDIDIALLVPAYIELLKLCNKEYRCKEHLKKAEHLELVLGEFEKQHHKGYREQMIRLWQSNHRIPQELITYEYLLKMQGGEGS
jgi:hypothetical protein